MTSSELSPVTFFRKFTAKIKANKGLFAVNLVVVLIGLIPLYGIVFPPLADLVQHILVNKLLWEKLAGVSNLDLEVSGYLGYRLLSLLIVTLISICKLVGIPLLYLPKLVVSSLILFHATVVMSILYFCMRNRTWGSYAFTICFSLPAIVSMYSACWFIGFVGYTLAITLLIPAIFFTERFLRSGKFADGCLLALSLFLVYSAHPFAEAFWLFWCLGRALAAVANRTISVEWKRMILLGAIFLPTVLYHFAATTWMGLESSDSGFLTNSPFVSFDYWYHFRIGGLLDGELLKADDATSTQFFGAFAIGLVIFSCLLTFLTTTSKRAKNLTLATIFLTVISSWLNENFIPTPGVHWLAYDYRFNSTIYAICLAVSAAVLVRFLPNAPDKLLYKTILTAAAIVSFLFSIHHLIETQQAYARFDAPARQYMAKILSLDKPSPLYLPHTRWHPDGTYLDNYICLEQDNCNPAGTSFRNYGGNLYPVILKSQKLVAKGPLVGYWKMDEANQGDECVDSSGNGNTGTPRSATVVEGKVNLARSFNGTTDYIDIPTISIPDAITVAAWVYSDKFLQDGFIVVKNPVNTQWALFLESDGFLKWRGSGGNESIKCAVPSNSTWHHVVATQSGKAASLYVDGVMCSSGDLPAIGNAPSSITIGRYDTIGYNYFTGKIDEVRIYNRALSSNEITRLLE